jgi:hypothetical protein
LKVIVTLHIELQNSATNKRQEVIEKKASIRTFSLSKLKKPIHKKFLAYSKKELGKLPKCGCVYAFPEACANHES